MTPLHSSGRDYRDGRFSVHTTEDGAAVLHLDSCQHVLSTFELDDLEELLHHVASILHAHGRVVDPRHLRIADAEEYPAEQRGGRHARAAQPRGPGPDR